MFAHPDWKLLKRKRVSGQAWLRKHVLFNSADSFILLNEENIFVISKGGEVSSNQKHIFQVGYFQVFIPLGHCY
jgi:hypothetical protein